MMSKRRIQIAIRRWLPTAISFLIMGFTGWQAVSAWVSLEETREARNQVVCLRTATLESADDLYVQIGENLGVISEVNDILHRRL